MFIFSFIDYYFYSVRWYCVPEAHISCAFCGLFFFSLQQTFEYIFLCYFKWDGEGMCSSATYIRLNQKQQNWEWENCLEMNKRFLFMTIICPYGSHRLPLNFILYLFFIAYIKICWSHGFIHFVAHCRIIICIVYNDLDSQPSGNRM